MPLQFRRGNSNNLPPASDAAVGEPIFTTDDGKLRIKKADGNYAVIGSGASAPGGVDLSGLSGSLVKVNQNEDGFAAADAGDLPSHTHSIANVAGLQAALDAKVDLDDLPQSNGVLDIASESSLQDLADREVSDWSGTISLGAAGVAQLPTPSDPTLTATIQWVPGTGWTIVSDGNVDTGTNYDPAVNFAPEAYGAAWPPSSGPYVQGVEVGDSYTGTVTLDPTTGTTGLTFAIDGTTTGSLTVAASQASPAVSAPSGFSLASVANRRRTVTVTATNGSATKVDTTTLDFGWRLVMFSLPSQTTVDGAVLQTAMQSPSADHRVRFEPNATVNNGGQAPLNMYEFVVPIGSAVNSIYFAHTVSGPSDTYGWNPIFTEPANFGYAENDWDLVGTYTADPGDGVAKSYKVWKHTTVWGPGNTLIQGVR